MFADAVEINALPSGNVEVMYTLAGDSRMTGTVNFVDDSMLQNNYHQNVPGAVFSSVKMAGLAARSMAAMAALPLAAR